VLRAEYNRLPRETREQLKTGFRAERERNDVMTWTRFLEVLLPLIPPEAR